jgi:hypothetical protein
MSPTQRTLALLKSWGWTAGIVERWVPGAFIRRDLFNIIDIIALTGKEIVGVQSCGEAFAEHQQKIFVEYAKNARLWIGSGGRLFLFGWRPLKVKRGGVAKRYEPRILEFFPFDFGDAMRTPKEKVAELRKRGRTYEQMRAVAVAREDKDLQRYVEELRMKDTEDLV